MEHEVSWEYWTDHEQNLKTTKFYLYRNPIYLGPDGQKRGQFCTDLKDPENPQNHISSSKPIAFGISVFFAMGLPKLRDLSDILYLEGGLSSANLYQLYFNIVSKSALNSIRQDRISNTEERILLEFQNRHLKEEKQYLIESEKYYSEFINEEDHNLKMVIKKHVNNYINWLSAKNKALLRQVAYIESRSKLNLINPKTAIKPKQPLSLSSLTPIEYIVLTEKILKYFNVCFREQAFPDFKPTIITFLKSIQPKDYEYVYYIHNDPLLFEPARFEILIKGLDMKKKRLQDILRVCLEFSKANSEIYFNLLANKRFEGYYSRYIEFEPMATYTSEYLDPPNDKVFNDFSNHKIGNYCNHIYSYLLYEVYDGFYKEANLNSTRNKQSENKKTIIPIVRSQLDIYKPFEYKQVVENLLNFIMFRFKSQVSIIQDHKDRENCNTEIRIIENQYLIDIHPDMLEFNYFKQRFSEMYASIEYKKEALQNLFNNTYQQARNIYQYYRENIHNVHFDKKETICLRYDQFEGTITFDVQSPSSILYTNNCLATFCQNIYTTIHAALYNNENELFKVNHYDISTNNKQQIIDIESFLKTTLEPLTKQEYQKGKDKKLVFCIDNSFKNHLIGCFLALNKKEDLPICTSKYDIKTNIPFYDAIITIQDKLNIQTKDLITIITESLYKDNDDLKRGFPRTVRNELSNARRRIK